MIPPSSTSSPLDKKLPESKRAERGEGEALSGRESVESIYARPKLLWLRVLVPFAMGYFLSYLFRMVNAVVAPDLTKDLGLSASDLGLLTGAYFLSFAAFQIPLGILLDRYSPQRVEAVLLLIAAAGATVFALSDSSGGLAMGRALIGLGVSACLMAGFTTCALWYAPQKLPVVNAAILSAGGLGALTATAPVEAVLQLTNWRGLFLGLASASLFVAALILFVVPRYRRPPHSSTWTTQLYGTLSVFRSPAFWRIAPAATITQAVVMAVQGLWAGPWLRNVAGFERDIAADYLLCTAAALFAGQLGWGIMASRLVRRGVAPLTLLKIGIFVFLCAQAALTVGAGATTILLPLWIIFGFFGVAGTLSYSIIAQQFPASLAGRANTAVNLLVFVFAFAAQWGFGLIVNAWATGVDEYAPTGYTVAFGTMLAVQLFSFVWLLRYRGTVPRALADEPAEAARCL
ncbi:MAG: MFS transporter [Gammaproteobacteria bacterium]|nr:MFS transporter [Gammaproteobacteria bacterium]